MARRFDDDDDDQPHWIFRFFRGAILATVLSVVSVVVLSLYVLPPAELPAPVETADTGPKVIDGIEVSSAPAYTAPAATEQAAAAPEAPTQPAGQPAPEAPAQPAAMAPAQLEIPAAETAQAGATASEMVAVDAAQPDPDSGPAPGSTTVPFEAPDGFPLVAVVLDDTAANPFLHALLFALNLPMTVGVVAGIDGDREVAAQARAAGYEVVAELPLAGAGQGSGTVLEFGMDPSEAATRTQRLIERLPMAVAASRPLAASGLPDPGTLKGMAEALSKPGLAYLDHGVRPGERSLVEMLGLGLPVGTGRYVIPASATAPDVLAVLDQAAMDAGPEGGAVIMAAPSEALFQALQLWGGEGSVSAGVLAPLSAVIARQAAGN